MTDASREAFEKFVLSEHHVDLKRGGPEMRDFNYGDFRIVVLFKCWQACEQRLLEARVVGPEKFYLPYENMDIEKGDEDYDAIMGALKLTPMNVEEILPSDEEITESAVKLGGTCKCCGECSNWETFYDGAKWLRDRVREKLGGAK